MKFTVVRSVREDVSTSREPPAVRLHWITQSDVLPRAGAMDIPFADAVIRLDFTGNDFAETVPATLA